MNFLFNLHHHIDYNLNIYMSRNSSFKYSTLQIFMLNDVAQRWQLETILAFSEHELNTCICAF